MQAKEVMDVLSIISASVTWDIWDFPVAQVVTRAVFITWGLPPLSFLKVNFDDGVKGSKDGSGFVIYDLKYW